MNRRELIAALSERIDTDKRKAEEALQAVLDVITETVSKGEAVAISGFAKFARRDVPAKPRRMGRNPATGEEMMLNPKPASRSVKITPLKAFKDAVITGKRRRPRRRHRPRRRRRRRRRHGKEEGRRRRRRRPRRRPRRRRRGRNSSPLAPFSLSAQPAGPSPVRGTPRWRCLRTPRAPAARDPRARPPHSPRSTARTPRTVRRRRARALGRFVHLAIPRAASTIESARS